MAGLRLFERFIECRLKHAGIKGLLERDRLGQDDCAWQLQSPMRENHRGRFGRRVDTMLKG